MPWNMWQIQEKCIWFFFLNFTTKHGEKIENANETDAWNISHTEWNGGNDLCIVHAAAMLHWQHTYHFMQFRVKFFDFFITSRENIF